MRFPRITVRRLMAVVGVAALMIWGGMLTWRWQHFRALARSELSVAERAARGEQRMRQRIALYQENMAKTDRELDQIRQEDGPNLANPEHELIDAQIKLFEWNKKRLDGELEKAIRSADDFARVRSSHEATALRYQKIARRPWVLNRHED